MDTIGTYGDTPSDIDAVKPIGTLKWKCTANGSFEATPAIGNDGQLVAGNNVGTVIALDARNGRLDWTFASPGSYGTNGFNNSSALLDANGTAYIQNQFGVFAISPEGSLQWRASQLAGYGASFGVDGAAGQLYVDTSHGLVALKSAGAAPGNGNQTGL